MAVASSCTPSSRLKAADLPPALRRAVEACPFDLLLWINPDCPVPPRPIQEDLQEWLQTGEALDGASARDWAYGRLPDIDRIGKRNWHWLALSEDPSLPTYRNPQEILEIAPQGLDSSSGTARRASLRKIHHGIERALMIRESLPGVSLGPDREAVREARRAMQIGEGAPDALDELFWFWKERGCDSACRRIRWNSFPRKVRVAIAGTQQRGLRDLAAGRGGIRTQEGRIRRARLRFEQGRCPGGPRCGQARWFGEFEGSPREAVAAYKMLDRSERQGICAEHYRTVSIGRARELARAYRSVQSDRFPPEDSRDKLTPEFCALCYRLPGTHEREKRSRAGIADFLNRHPSLLQSVGRSGKVSSNNVGIAIRRHRLQTESGYAKEALGRWQRRKSAAFDRWVRERLEALDSPSAVGRELVAMPESERAQRFGGFLVKLPRYRRLPRIPRTTKAPRSGARFS